MSRSYYTGSDPVRLSIYARAKTAYSRHFRYCDECRALLVTLTEIGERQQLPADVDAGLEAWARERINGQETTQEH